MIIFILKCLVSAHSLSAQYTCYSCSYEIDIDDPSTGVACIGEPESVQPVHCPAGNECFSRGVYNLGGFLSTNRGGHGGRVVTLSPPTSEAGGSVPVTASSGKAGSCLPLVGSLQYRTLTNCMHWFPPPFQLPVVI